MVKSSMSVSSNHFCDFYDLFYSGIPGTFWWCRQSISDNVPSFSSPSLIFCDLPDVFMTLNKTFSAVKTEFSPARG